MKNYPNIAARVFNKPLLAEPSYARVFIGALREKIHLAELRDADVVLSSDDLAHECSNYIPGRRSGGERPYEVIDGVAVLPVQGTLVHKLGVAGSYSGQMGYDGIMHRASIAFADPEVRGVLMDMDTPGGEVAGCFDCSRTLRKMADASGKQLGALGYDMYASAGMAIASAAHFRMATQTAIVGSVGVIMAHASFEGALEDAGIKVTLIRSGAHKGEGNPYEDLPADVLARFQSQTDSLRQEFAELMAEHMPLTVQQILATEAAVFRAEDAIEVGFADQIVNGSEGIALFAERLSAQGRTRTFGANTMDPNKEKGSGPAAEAEKPETTAEVETEVETEAGSEAAKAAAQEQESPETQEQPKATGSDERARIKGILSCEEAEGRKELAEHLAYETEMSVDQAKGILAKAPEATEQQSALDKHMETQSSQVTAGAGGGDNQDEENEGKAAVASLKAYRGKAKTG